MSQTFLTENPPMILDATSSDKKRWPASASVRVDKRREVAPDIVALDELLPFRDCIFDRIFCDPPHIIGRTLLEKPKMSPWFASQNRKRYPHEHFLNSVGRFGTWTSRMEWLEYVHATNGEFARLLKPEGVLEYKVCESRSHGNFVRLGDVLVGMNRFKLDSITQTTSKFGKNLTYWLTMKPKEMKV